MSNQSPFFGVIETIDGEFVDLFSGLTVTQDQIGRKLTPFYGRFIDVDGVEHDLLELFGGGIGGDGISLGQLNAAINTHNLSGVSHADLRALIAAINESPFTHSQNVAADIWTIPHNLGKQYVNVQLIDYAGNDCTADLDYTSVNVVTVIWPRSMAGTAIIRR